jgi:hypothetical protein
MQQEAGPMDPHIFVERTGRELVKILKKHDPIWTVKLNNFIDLKEGLAFRYGFMMGAVLSAITAVVFVLVIR